METGTATHLLEMKEALTSNSILVYPGWRAKVTLHIDASELTAGAALTQERYGWKHVLAYARHGGLD